MKKQNHLLGLALASVWASVGCASLQGKFIKEVTGMGLPQGPGEATIITEADLADKPPAVQRYLRFMGVVGQPRDWSFKMKWTGRFRTKPDQGWMPIEAHQYNTRLDIARIFYMEARMFGFVPVMGRDTLVGGKGRMEIRPFDLLTIEDGKGMEFDIREFTTYLNDGIMFAPSLLLGSETKWINVDANTFDVCLTDRGRTVTARVYLDEKGAPKDFSTTDRYYGEDPKHPVEAQWNTPVSGWTTINGRSLPTKGQATWKLPQGDFTYAEFEIDPQNMVYNVSPGK